MAAAAYRAGERLFCDYYGVYFDYTKKKGVLLSEIILPEHVPEKYKDRRFLWDSVEKTEKNSKAQLAYSFDIALQNELTMEENIALARRFILENFTQRGMIADWALHNPEPKEGQAPNPHFHVLCPIRPMNENGEWGAKQRREYLLDENGNRKKNENGKYIFNAVPTTDWGSPDTLEQWRKNWADLVNEKFREKGLEEFFIDNSSYKERGIDQIPQIHEGAAVKRLEEKGFRTDKGLRNRWIKSINRMLKELAEKIQELIERIKETKAAIKEMKDAGGLTVGTLVSEYLEHRNMVADGYSKGSQKAKSSNLQLVSSLYAYVQEKNIVTMDDLERAAKDLEERARVPKAVFDRQKEDIRFTEKQIRDAKAVIKNQAVFDESQKIWFTGAKKKFQKEHEKELRQYHAALRNFGTTGFVPDKAFLEKLEQRLAEEEEKLRQIRESTGAIREEYHILQEIRKAVDTSINDRKERGMPAEVLRDPEWKAQERQNSRNEASERGSFIEKMKDIKEKQNADREKPEQRLDMERKRNRNRKKDIDL